MVCQAGRYERPSITGGYTDATTERKISERIEVFAVTRKRYIKLIMSLLYTRDEAVAQAKYINDLMKTDPRCTYQVSWDIIDEYDNHCIEVMYKKKAKEYG